MAAYGYDVRMFLCCEVFSDEPSRTTLGGYGVFSRKMLDGREGWARVLDGGMCPPNWRPCQAAFEGECEIIRTSREALYRAALEDAIERGIEEPEGWARETVAALGGW